MWHPLLPLVSILETRDFMRVACFRVLIVGLLSISHISVAHSLSSPILLIFPLMPGLDSVANQQEIFGQALESIRVPADRPINASLITIWPQRS